MRNKRLTLLLLSAMVWTAAFCQTSPKVKQQVQEIRKAYQAAQKFALEAKTSEEIHLRNYSEFIHHVNHAGSGPSKEVMEFFFDTNEHVEEVFYETYDVFLIRRSWNIAAMNQYEEYLFDRETYKPIFYYYKGYNVERDCTEEIRWYIKDWVLLYEIVKDTNMEGKTIREEAKEINSDEGDFQLTLRRGMSYVDGFNSIENLIFE